mgnify:CR=1 FL=1
MAQKKYVYSFKEAHEGKIGKEILGGKGFGLAEMTAAGINIPDGFTISTEACNLYYASGKTIPDYVWEDIVKHVHAIEEESGKSFGGGKGMPLLVSVRSGARVSMPGMMDTILNLGSNDQTVAELIAATGNERFAWDSYRRFILMFTAQEDVDVVIALSDGSNTIQQVAYTITVPGILPRIEIVENTLNDAAVLRDSLAVTHILQVNVFDSKTKFVQDDSLADVLDNMEHLQDLRLAIQVNYASGLKVLFHATSVKPNYISLHAKAGSCELHLASDGSFTIAGTSLW